MGHSNQSWKLLEIGRYYTAVPGFSTGLPPWICHFSLFLASKNFLFSLKCPEMALIMKAQIMMAHVIIPSHVKIYFIFTFYKEIRFYRYDSFFHHLIRGYHTISRLPNSVNKFIGTQSQSFTYEFLWLILCYNIRVE